MKAEQLMDMLFVAAEAKTEEQKARIAWRASDYMWRHCLNGEGDFWTCRRFNNLCQEKQWPWVRNLWSEEEMREAKDVMEARSDSGC